MVNANANCVRSEKNILKKKSYQQNEIFIAITFGERFKEEEFL